MTPIVVIDLDRVLNETQQGALLLAKLDQEAQELDAEFSRIRDELTEEERELTERRAELSPEEFRDLADAFDARVRKLRAETDEKDRILSRAADEARQRFALDVIFDIARARGAFVVLDQRYVILFADSVNITDEAIRRINQMAVEAAE